MKFTLAAVLLLLMLNACGSPAEETRPPDTASQILPETVFAETEENEKTSVLSERDPTILMKDAAEEALELLEEKNYVVTGEAVTGIVPFHEVEDCCTFEKKPLEKMAEDGALDENFILVEVPTDQGTVPLVYNLGLMLISEKPAAVEHPVPEMEITDTSLPVELNGAAPVTVHGIRKYFVGYDKGLQKNSLLFRITAPEELEQVRQGLDYFWEYDHDEIDFAQYDDAWFETRDLYIADMGTGGSYPDLEIMEVTDGNYLRLVYEHSNVATEDIIGRLVFVEVNKGDILTWSAADDRYYTADAFAAQVEQWILADCWQSARSRISREDTFVTGLPEITYPTLVEIPENLRGGEFAENAERYGLTEESFLIRLDIPAADGAFTAVFTESGEWLEFVRIE